MQPGTREIAEVEKKLNQTATEGYEVRVDESGGRIWFDTWEPNPAFRGEIVANICTDIAESDHWELVRVHDPIERDSGLVQAGVTMRRTDGDR
jgi:hypothetical protein